MKIDFDSSGTCVITVFVQDTDIIISNIGDSKYNFDHNN